jgi:predicted metal-binding membrane protein
MSDLADSVSHYDDSLISEQLTTAYFHYCDMRKGERLLRRGDGTGPAEKGQKPQGALHVREYSPVATFVTVERSPWAHNVIRSLRGSSAMRMLPVANSSIANDPFPSSLKPSDRFSWHNTAMSPVPQTDDRATALAGHIRARAPYIMAFLVFLCAAGATLYFNYTMSGGMRMPGHWTMSMMWMPMGGELGAAGIFAVMWLAMMVAMMLPSTMPMLLLYRRAADLRGTKHVGQAMFVLGGGYFFVWTLFGVLVYVIGVFLARGAMHSDVFSRAFPFAGGLALCIAGIYQLTPWKTACLKHCRDPLTLVADNLDRGRFGALRIGIHHGAFCAACCWALMLIQLVLGVMNLAAMVAVAVVIALEKLLPRGQWLARAAGLVAIGAGIIIAALSVRAF